MIDDESIYLSDLTAKIVCAYVAKNRLSPSELLVAIASIGRSLGCICDKKEKEILPPSKPAVPIDKSVHKDFLICLEDGQKFKSMKRHLSAHHGLTPEAYREKWNLPHNYPMVAENYAAVRSSLAKQMGLGQRSHKPSKQVVLSVRRPARSLGRSMK